MNSTQLVVTTVDSQAEAKRLAEKVIDSRLAACVSIGAGVLSIYEWKSERVTEHEIPIQFKTDQSRTEELMNWLRKNHPYDCPELLVIQPQQVDENYASWVKESVSSS